jgi:hypothetical protein
MHGSSYTGNGKQALQDLAELFKDVLGSDAQAAAAD